MNQEKYQSGSNFNEDEDIIFSQASEFDLFERRFNSLELEESECSEEDLEEKELPEHACK